MHCAHLRERKLGEGSKGSLLWAASPPPLHASSYLFAHLQPQDEVLAVKVEIPEPVAPGAAK